MLSKKSVSGILGYVIALSVGIICGMTLKSMTTEKENNNMMTEIVQASEEDKNETLPSAEDNRAYFLKIEDNVLKQYRRENNGILTYEKDLTYIDIISLDTEFTERLSEGVMFANSVALAEFIENLDS